MKFKKLTSKGVVSQATDIATVATGMMVSGSLENIAPRSMSGYAKGAVAILGLAGAVTVSNPTVSKLSLGVALKQTFDLVTGQLRKVIPVKPSEERTLVDNMTAGFVGMSSPTSMGQIDTMSLFGKGLANPSQDQVFIEPGYRESQGGTDYSAIANV